MKLNFIIISLENSRNQRIFFFLNMIQKEIEIGKLGRLIPDKMNLYQVLSCHYFLPQYDSHACTIQYLNKYTEDPIPIYVCEIKNTEIFNIRFKNANAEELLDLLEKLLAEKNKPQTGLDILHIPDVKWLCTVLHKEDPTDSIGVFKKKTGNITIIRTINDKYL